MSIYAYVSHIHGSLSLSEQVDAIDRYCNERRLSLSNLYYGIDDESSHRLSVIRVLNKLKSKDTLLLYSIYAVVYSEYDLSSLMQLLHERDASIYCISNNYIKYICKLKYYFLNAIK